VTSAAAPQDQVVVIEPSHGWTALQLGEVWRYRELLLFLAWRDVKVRYKQAVLGVAWAVLQPLLFAGILAFVFTNVARVNTGSVSPFLYSLTGLVPWQLFSGALSRSSGSLVSSASLLTKVYFPRLVIPVGTVLAGVVDFAVSLCLVAIAMAVDGVAPTLGLLTVPLLAVYALAAALSVGVWLAALNVKYRDVQHIVPFLVLVWMYVSPVGYPVSAVPERWQLIYALNPVVGVIEAFRWALLGTRPPQGAMLVSAVTVTFLLVSGLYYFRRTERSFADVV
jgi:lipopolysaccharide transport system permease protein